MNRLIFSSTDVNSNLPCRCLHTPRGIRSCRQHCAPISRRCSTAPCGTTHVRQPWSGMGQLGIRISCGCNDSYAILVYQIRGIYTQKSQVRSVTLRTFLETKARLFYDIIEGCIRSHSHTCPRLYAFSIRVNSICHLYFNLPFFFPS